MKIKVELKTKITNDTYNRVPDINTIKNCIDQYIIGFKGVVILHDSMYNFNYDTRNKSYNNVDTTGVVGHIESSIIEDNMLFLIIEVDDTAIQGDKYICMFRSRMSSTPSAVGNEFDEFNIFAVDLINVEESEDIKERYLSKVII